MRQEELEFRAAEILKSFDPEGRRTVGSPRPFMIELFGTPKSGKSTMKEMLKHFFRRNGWSVSTPTEGAEIVELPRDEPQYNFQTTEYALGMARERSYDPNFHLVIFDRAIMDGVVRMDFYGEKAILTVEQRQTIQNYFLLPWNRELFDAHVCLVANPEAAIRRELARALTKKHGKTMNPRTLADLLKAHERVWERFNCGSNPKMCWHDSSKEKEAETARNILSKVLDAFETRLKS
ncbi:hypothetical protein HYT45_04265 [Candidatus Uhrbacteria bacterium]|nr:hypothetical protein [Candidatus Uhrbacteria bacterium]